MRDNLRFLTLVATCLLSSYLPQARAQSLHRLWALHNSTYDVLYDNIDHVPVSVTWKLRPKDFQTKRSRVAKYFRADNRVSKPRVKHADFDGSGYMRGHLCPAGDRTETKALMKSTFLMTNVAPMTEKLNCGLWSDLEVKTRQLAIKYDSVRVIVACLFLTGDSIYIGSGRVRVPSHFLREVRALKNDSILLWQIVSQ